MGLSFIKRPDYSDARYAAHPYLDLFLEMGIAERARKTLTVHLQKGRYGIFFPAH